MTEHVARSVTWLVTLACGAVLLASCNRQPQGGSSGVTAAAPSAAPTPPPPPAVPPSVVAAAAAPSPIGCRVMSATGPAQRGSGAPVHGGERLSGADWLELGKGSKLHLKHGESGREWTLNGPARLFPCVDGQEELIVAEGKLRAESGAGIRPGAQVLIGTPFGSLRYTDASADLAITRDALSLRVSAGDTWLRPGASAAAEMHSGRSQSLRRGLRERLSSAQAVALCAQNARDSEALAKALLTPGAAGLGKRAADHVRARELAHASCASATAAVLQQDAGEQRAARLSELLGYREQWRRVPAAGS